MTPTGGFDDFAKGEQQAARLVAQMQRALQRAEQLQAQAEREAQLARRSGATRAGEPGRPAAGEPAIPPQEQVQRRITDEEALNAKMREREQLAQREAQALESQATMMRRLQAMGPAAYTQGTLFGPANQPPLLPPGGGGGGPRLPPTAGGGGFYGYPPPPGRPQLPAGPPPPLQLGAGPPYPGQRALPAPGQTVGGSQYMAKEVQQTQGAARAYDQYRASQAAASSEAVRFNRSLGENLFIQQQANTQYQRFGALSSEWIGAAARGSTTIQELGRQTAVTVGKFGGWIAAGGFLYTALGAVRAIGQGAIDSSSGVNQLQRVVNNVEPGSAQAGFRKYSEQFNLPIKEVSQAAYEMGKVFHDQDQALEASKAVLYSVKVGELDTATASRYLIAIINGFHLPANNMVQVFDQLNGAQNKFGITINDVEAGVAKAAGAFNAATTKGGPLEKYHELLALITTAQKATGQTGQVVGTAIQRAPNFLRQKKNQAILRSYGIDAGNDLNAIIQQAFQVAQGLSGHEIGKLAAAIFGPQYGARIGTPLLQQFDLYKKVLAGTSKEATKNSGQIELNTLLHSMSEELTKIVNEMQALGSNLAQAGFLDVFGESVVLLGQFLHEVNALLDLFNQLPAPLTHTLAVMLEIYGVVKLLRKFNLGDSFGEGTLGRRVFSPPNRAQGLLQESYGGQIGFFTQQREKAATTASQAEIGVRTAQQRVLQEEEQFAAIKAEQGATSEAALAQEQNLVRAQNALNAAQQRKFDAEVTEVELLTAQIEVESKKAALAGLRNDAEVRAFAARQGDIIPPNYNQPVSGKEAAAARGYQVTKDAAGNTVLVPGGAAAARAEAMATDVGKEAEKLGPRLRSSGRAWAQLGAVEASLANPMMTYRHATDAAGTALRSSGSALTTAASSVRGVGTSMTRAGLALRGLGSELYSFIGGPIGLLLGGVFAATQYGDDLGRLLAGGQDTIDRAAAPDPQSAKQIRGFLHAYARQVRKGNYSWQDLAAMGNQDFVAPGVPDYYTAQRATEDRRLLQAQRGAERRGTPAIGLLPDQLKRQVEDLKQYRIGTAKFNEQFARVKTEVEQANRTADPKGYKEVRDEFRGLGAKALNTSTDVAGLFKDFQAQADKILKKQIDNYSTLVQAGSTFSGQSQIRGLTNRVLIFGLRGLQSSKIKTRADAAQALSQLPQTLQQYGQSDLDISLALAKTQKERDAAYGKYIDGLQGGAQTIRRLFGNTVGGLRAKLKRTEDDLAQLRAEGKAGTITPQQAHEFGVDPHGPDPIVKQLKQRAQVIRKALKNAGDAQDYELRQIRALIAEQRQQQLQERVGVIQQHGEIAAARIGSSDPVGQARASLKASQAALTLLRGSSAAQPKDIADALLTMLQARQSLTDAVRQQAQDLADATQQLAEARANGDPVLEAKAQIDKARADINLAQTTAERRTALAELITAQHQLDQAYADIAIARLHVREAETDNPVKQATYRVREAEIQLRNAHGAQAKLEAQASKQQAIRDRRDAIAQARIDDIEFQASIGKITLDQEIFAYNRLLNTLTLSRDLRRSIRQKIHDLRSQDSFELAVGDIQLPTIYDIRRAVQGGINGNPTAQYHDNSTTNVNVNVNGGDPRAVGRAVDNAINRHTRNARRSAGHIPG